MPLSRRRAAQSSMVMLAAVTGVTIWFAVLAMLAAATVRAERGRLLQAEAHVHETFSRAEAGAVHDALGGGTSGLQGSALDWNARCAVGSHCDGEFAYDVAPWLDEAGGLCAFAEVDADAKRDTDNNGDPADDVDGPDYACWRARLGESQTVQARGSNVNHRERLLTLHVIADCVPTVGYTHPEASDTAAKLAEACDTVQETNRQYRQRSFLQYGLHVDSQAVPPGQRRFVSGRVYPVSLLDSTWGDALIGVPTHFNDAAVRVCIPAGSPSPDDTPPVWLESLDEHDGDDDQTVAQIEAVPSSGAGGLFVDVCGADDNAAAGWQYRPAPSTPLLVSAAADTGACPTDPSIVWDPADRTVPLLDSDGEPVRGRRLPRTQIAGVTAFPPGHHDDAYGPAYPRFEIEEYADAYAAEHGVAAPPHGYDEGSEYQASPRVPPYQPANWMLPAFALAGGHPNSQSPPEIKTPDVLLKWDRHSIDSVENDPIWVEDWNGGNQPVRAYLTVDLGTLRGGEVIASLWDLRVVGQMDSTVPDGATATIVSAGSILIDVRGPRHSRYGGGVDSSGDAVIGAAFGTGDAVALIAGCDIIIDTYDGPDDNGADPDDNIDVPVPDGLPHRMTPRPHWWPCSPSPPECLHTPSRLQADGPGVAGANTRTLPAPRKCISPLRSRHSTTLNRMALLAPSGGIYPRLAECPRTPGIPPEIRIIGTVAGGYLGAFSFSTATESNRTGYDIELKYPAGWRDTVFPWWPDPLGGNWQPVS